jgi:8-oxo-dGTP pyrophosphatase MutT (NUDIX family)
VPSRCVVVGFFSHPDTGTVLLHLRADDAPTSPGAWASLGGHSEPEDGGDPVATRCREVREEAGISLEAARAVPLCAGTQDDGVRWYAYYAEWPSLDTTLVLGEGRALGWFTLDEARALPNLAAYARSDLLLFRARREEAPWSA